METVYVYVPLMPDKLEALIEAAEKAVMKAFQQRFDKPEEPEAPQYICIKEAAAILNRSRQSLYSYITRGILKAYKVQGVRGMSFMKSEVIGVRKRVQFKYLQTPE